MVIRLFSIFFAIALYTILATPIHAQCAPDEYVSDDLTRCIQRPPKQLIIITLPNEWYCDIGFYNSSDLGRFKTGHKQGGRVTKDEIIGSAFYQKMKTLEQTNPQACGAAKQEFDKNLESMEKFNYSGKTASTLRDVSRVLSRPNPEGIRRQAALEAAKRRQAAQIAEWKRQAAESRARQQEMMERKRQRYEQCRATGLPCASRR